MPGQDGGEMMKTRGKTKSHAGNVGQHSGQAIGLDLLTHYTTVRGNCQVPYQFKNVNLSELLALADLSLEQANHHKALWLATGELRHWRLWQACLQDRLDLLAEVGHG
jgi:hypothetical protein